MPTTSLTARSIVAALIITVAMTLTGCSTNAEPGTRGLAGPHPEATLVVF